VTFTLEKAPAFGGGGLAVLPIAGGRARNVGGLEMEPYPVAPRSCQTDLELVLEEEGGILEGVLCYSTTLFDVDRMERMVGHFLTLLDSIAADPGRRLSELPWLTDAERQQVVRSWNETKLEFADGVCLHELFEQQAVRTPTPGHAARARTVRYGS
jgi:non-ribosomal peptide synthetase component F